jgi:periplasmic protein TonB
VIDVQRGDEAVVMAGDGGRRSASLAASLALHGAFVAALLARGVVHLELQPAPILVTLVEAAARTAGPGERAPELRVAALAASAPVVEAPPEKTVEPELVPVPVAKPKPVAKKAADKPKPAAAPPAGTNSAAVASAVGAIGEGGAGSDARSTAPAWAPTARVRYEELLFAWMDRHKDYPMMAQRRGLQGNGSVRVRIDRDGRVLDRSIASSTGEAMLDDAALDMVRRSNPFPRVPDEYAGASFEFVAPVQYRLR